jgi:hypothetical protein
MSDTPESDGDPRAEIVTACKVRQVALLAGPDEIPARHHDALQKRRRSPARLRNVWAYLSRKVS